jgi:ABC-type nickel/cobalt efflux system permease component RcnA
VALLGPSPTLAALVLGVFVAMGLGAAHAISPGHGKTLVAAYVIGSRANLGHALWLGITVAVTHTAGVLILGVVTFAFTELLVPERVVGWLSVAAGLMIIALGATLIWRAWAITHAFTGTAQHHGHTHTHDGGHEDVHDHHEHVEGPHSPGSPALRRRDVALLGIIGGLIPSTSALLLLLSSVSLGHVGFGIVLIVAFGLGMALILAGISGGIVLLRHSRLLAWERWRDPRMASLGRMLPLVSGVLVIGFGILLTLQAVSAVR